MNASAAQRIVAIVGRPNVGKSAIFNRLVGRRAAIVHSQSGVTRDRLMREVTWDDERFELIDTGGLCRVEGEGSLDQIERGVRGQVEAAVADAAVVVFVTDVAAGILPLDEEVAQWLHSSGKQVLIAANKADDASRDGLAAEFETFGFPVFAVSAMHNRGFEPLMTQALEALPAAADVAAVEPLKVAVVGRPNVGKSSYINRLLHSDRVLVCDAPGTTRDSIAVPFVVGQGEQARHYVLIDTAGMKRTRKLNSSVEHFSQFRAERSIRDANVVVLVLDATRPPGRQDKWIAARTLEEGKGCLILVNKWDLQTKTQRAFGPEILHALPFMAHCPVVFVSAATGYNIRRSVEAIDYVGAQVQTSLPTAVLNRAIEDACRRVTPPSHKGKRLKIFYATQVGREPIRIRLFVNDPSRVAETYRQYLVRRLRESFGLDGAPVQLQFRHRREPSREPGKARRRKK